MKQQLEKLGFTPNEAKVYLALLEIGQTPSGALIKKTGLHRNIVYEALDALIRRRLVRGSVQKGKNVYSILDPQVIIDEIHEMVSAGETVAKLIREKAKTEAPQVTVYEGRDGWQTAYRRVTQHLRPRSSIVVLGAGGDKWFDAMGDFFIMFENFIRKQHISYRMIAYEWQRAEIAAHQMKLLTEVRYLPEKNEVPANTEIFPDRVFVQIYSEPPMLIEIMSQNVVKGYQQHFETLWEVAKK